MSTYIDILNLPNNDYKRDKFTSDILQRAENSFTAIFNNTTYTENGAVTNISSQDPVLDWFFHGPALRYAEKDRILTLFTNAFKKDPALTLKILFYIRDCRGGQGEREIFRTCLVYLAEFQTQWLKNNLGLIPEYGRWDDLFVLFNSKVKDETIDFIGSQLAKDLKYYMNNEYQNLSLLGKWMPSENAKDKERKAYAKILLATEKFGSAKNYRKALSMLRKALKIVEINLANKDYASIDYSKLPSYAALKYRMAFLRNDKDHYQEYLDSLKKGETKINTSTLYPYDILRAYDYKGYGWAHDNYKVNETLELQWKNLPDYVPEISGIPVCDTSGSMEGFPIQVATALSLYIAERNKSEIWKNYVIPFSSHAEWKQVTGETLIDKAKSIYTGDCSNTNLQAVFNMILGRAVANNIPQDDMPKVLLILSDMEFDYIGEVTNFEAIKKKYQEAGYCLPTLVWWNIQSRNTQVPVTIDNTGNILLSGCSPSCLKIALSGKCDMYKIMLDIIQQPRYEQIKY